MKKDQFRELYEKENQPKPQDDSSPSSADDIKRINPINRIAAVKPNKQSTKNKKKVSQDSSQEEQSMEFKSEFEYDAPAEPKQVYYRWKRLPMNIDIQDLLDQNKKEKFDWKTICSTQDEINETERDPDKINDQAPEGDQLEKIEEFLQDSVNQQMKAVKNWVKLGLRIQMIQAFKMLDQVQTNLDSDQSQKCCSHSIIISRNSKTKMIWSLITNLFYFYSYFNIPYSIAFEQDESNNDQLRNTELFLDFIILADIIFSFFADNYSTNANMEHLLTNKQIAKNYLKSYLIPDLLSCAPGILSGEKMKADSALYWLKLFRYTQVPRSLLQLEHWLRFLMASGRKWIVENSIGFIKRNTIFLLVFHLFACIWIGIGSVDTDQDQGWVNKQREADEKGNYPDHLKQWSIYASAIYFIITTATTVGYGDYVPSTRHEQIFAIIIQFVGICTFSNMTGHIREMKSQPTLQTILEKKEIEIQLYLQIIDQKQKKIKQQIIIDQKDKHIKQQIFNDYGIDIEDKIDEEVYDQAVEYIEHSYRIGVVQSLQRDKYFYSKLPPTLKNEICFSLLKSYYEKFQYFFNDFDKQNFADTIFIRKILTNMDCQIFIKGSIVQECGKQFTQLYFCYKNGVTVKNPFMNFHIAEMNEGSFFGDFQILLGTISMFEYRAQCNTEKRKPGNQETENTWLMTINKAKFLSISDLFPEFRDFLLVRGLQRRAFLKHTQHKVVTQLGIQKVHSRIKRAIKIVGMEELAKKQVQFFKPMESVRLVANFNKLKMKSKTARKYFQDMSLEILLGRKSNMHLSFYEIPRMDKERVQILFAIPAVKQYFQATSAKMLETKELVHQNFNLFRQYFNIFNQLKEIYKKADYPCLRTHHAVELLDKYKMFVYEKPLPNKRGLPAMDEDGNPIVEKIQQEVLGSSDESYEANVSNILANINNEQLNPLFNNLRTQFLDKMRQKSNWKFNKFNPWSPKKYCEAKQEEQISEEILDDADADGDGEGADRPATEHNNSLVMSKMPSGQGLYGKSPKNNRITAEEINREMPYEEAKLDFDSSIINTDMRKSRALADTVMASIETEDANFRQTLLDPLGMTPIERKTSERLFKKKNLKFNIPEDDQCELSSQRSLNSKCSMNSFRNKQFAEDKNQHVNLMNYSPSLKEINNSKLNEPVEFYHDFASGINKGQNFCNSNQEEDSAKFQQE